jgi:acetoacetyl-CoA synthetase
MSAFIDLVEKKAGRQFSSYREFESFSITHPGVFWSHILGWTDFEGDSYPAIVGSDCEHARFFPGVRLNYAENLLRLDDRDLSSNRPAVTAVHADRPPEHLTRGELRAKVRTLSAALLNYRLGAGDRVAIVAHNTPGAIIGALGAVAIGCTVCTVAPDLGSTTLAARLQQVEPTLIMVDLAASRGMLLQQQMLRIAEIVRALPSVHTLLVLDERDWPPNPPIRIERFTGQPAAGDDEHFWPRFPFNHPLFILFTSGTTGPPKSLVHGAGGTLLEHLKEHRLHCDLSAADKLYFQTSTGWMMWNWQLSALASGVEILLYDGPITSADCLWRIVSEQRVTVFGTSPAYLQMGESSKQPIGQDLDLSALRSILSTGSILSSRHQDWVSRCVKPLPIQSISGGTDIIGCFVLGNPNIPLYSAECQCRSLGLDVRAVGTNGRDTSGVGELVCANPFPSRPLGILKDPEGRRFHDSYFAKNPACWTHGDLLEITDEGSILMHGRSDGVLNVRGVRIGPAEIYRILESLAPIADAMAVEQSAPEEIGGARLVLLVVLKEGYQLDDKLRSRIKRTLAQRGSPAHVPSEILAVAELPMTYSGKKSERSARDALNGSEAANAEALRNPECLRPLIEFTRQQRDRKRAGDAEAKLPAHTLSLAGMTALWERVLNVRPLSPHDNFFDVGGDSLTALRLIEEIARQTDRRLPLISLLERPTIAQLVALANGEEILAFEPAVLLRSGSGRAPLFIVHGYGGSVMELRQVAQLVRGDTAIYGIQASGLETGGAVNESVEAMSETYLAAVKEIQPHGPYLLAGYSAGGLVAWEMAKSLREAGETVAFLGFMDTVCHERYWNLRAWREFVLRRTLLHARDLPRLGMAGAFQRLGGIAVSLLQRITHTRQPQNLEGLPDYIRAVRRASFAAFARYKPVKGDVPITLIRSDLALSSQCDPALLWRDFAPQVRLCNVSGSHESMLRPPHVSALADTLSECLREAGEPDAPAIMLDDSGVAVRPLTGNAPVSIDRRPRRPSHA